MITATRHKHRSMQLLFQVCMLLGAAIAVTTTGCNTQGCTENRSALPMMGFYSSTTGNAITLDSLEIGGVGAPDDSLLVHSGEKVKTLYLPFRFDSDETSFFIHYDYKEQGLDSPEFDDKISIRYTSEPYFASEECGAYYIYTIKELTYTTHLIDRIEIVDSIISNIDMERIKVFFRTSEMESPDTPGSGDDDTDDDDTGQDNGEGNGDATGQADTAVRRGLAWRE